jgi:type I restriction enzyme, S subunit
MMKTRSLSELCDPARGITYGIVKVGDYIPDGIPVVRGGDIRQNKVVFDDSKRVSREISDKFKRTILRGGEIVINLIAEAGHSAIVPEYLVGANVSRDVAVVPLIDSVDHAYVNYVLQSPECIDWLHARLDGGVTQKINLSTLREVPVPLPHIDDQRAIARTLGTLDEKIELNRQTNSTLETISRTLFRSWFVTFDPIAARDEGGLTRGLNAKLAREFPSTFVESSSWGAPVPAGWDVEPLDSIANFKNGLALQKYRPAPDEERLPVIKIAQLRAGVPGKDEWASAAISPSCILENGDIVFSWSGSLLVKPWCGGRGALNQHLFKVTSDRFPKWFYHQWTLHHLPTFQDIAADKATTMGHIRRYHLTEAVCVVPSPGILAAANRLLGPFLERFISMRLESQALLEMRALLLPKLISGEIRPNIAEKTIEEAL